MAHQATHVRMFTRMIVLPHYYYVVISFFFGPASLCGRRVLFATGGEAKTVDVKLEPEAGSGSKVYN